MPLTPVTSGLQTECYADYTDGSTEGAAVGSWTDQSGNGNHITASGSLRGTLRLNRLNGLRTVRLDGPNGNGQRYVIPAGVTANVQAVTQFWVVRPYNRTTPINALSSLGSDQYAVYSVTGLLQWAANAPTNSKVGLVYGWQIVSAVGSTTSASSALRINGRRADIAGVPGAAALSGGTLGSVSSGVFPFDGEIAGFLAYNVALSDAEVASVEAFLSTRYAPNAVAAGADLLVIEGDSYTQGFGATSDANTYPGRIAAALPGKTVIVPAVAGSTLSGDMPTRAAYIDSLYASGHAGNTLVVLVGHNDLWSLLLNRSPAQVKSDLEAYCVARKAQGYRIVLVDLVPSVALSTNRTTYNALLAADFTASTASATAFGPASGITYADRLVKVSALSPFASGTAYTNPTYYNADQIHLTDAGYLAVANAVGEALDFTPAVGPSATPTTVTGTTSALAANLTNGTAPFTYAWTTTAKPTGSNPVFSNSAVANPTVTFEQAGSYTFSLTVTDGNGLTDTETVSVTASQTLSDISITPVGATAATGGTLQMTMTGEDQFGDAIAGLSPTWSVASGVGTIHASTGLYSAGIVPGFASVAAAEGGFTASVVVIAEVQNPAGVYFTWPGIQSILGTANASTHSNLDPSESSSDIPAPDFARIQDVGNLADAYTNRRARWGNTQYLTPIPDTSADFPLIRKATNLYAAYQLVRHRIWFGGEAEDERSRIMLGLNKQAMELYDLLFGPARQGDGIDGATADPDGSPEPGTLGTIEINRGECELAADEFAS